MGTTTLAIPAFEETEPRARSAAVTLLCVYVFMLYSRIFEAAVIFGLPNLYPMLILSAAGLTMVVFKGEFPRAIRMPVAIILILFTMWAIFTVPFSHWKSESLTRIIDWLKSVAAFFIIAGLTRDVTAARRLFSSLGYGVAVSAVVLALTNRNYGDRATSVGSFGNANEVAFHIWFGLPFLIVLLFHAKPILKIPLGLAALLSLALAFKTGSRAGLLMAVAITVLALLKVSLANKAKIIAAMCVAAVIAVFTINETALERYKTVLGESDSSQQALSAKESTESRTYLLKEGIQLTMTHPIFGVGMGVFPVAAAELSESRGEHPLWLQSHNSYVQISSETGFPGLALYVAVFVVTGVGLWRLDRALRRLAMNDLRAMCLCALLSFVALTIHFTFDAIAYEYYLPMIAAIGGSLVFVARPVIVKAESSAKAAPAERVPEMQTVGVSATPVLSPAQTQRPQAPARNPYRLGRRRVQSKR